MSMKVEGLDELCSNFDRLLMTQYPKEADKFMKAEGRKLANIAKKIARSRVKTKGASKKDAKKSYRKGIKAGKRVYDWGDKSKNLRVYHSSPHGHLVDLGHKIVSHGEATGDSTDGHHALEDALKQFEDEFASDVRNNMGDFIVKELTK